VKKILTLITIIFSVLVFTNNSGARSNIQTVKYAINLNWCGKPKKVCAEGQKALNVRSTTLEACTQDLLVVVYNSEASIISEPRHEILYNAMSA